jgi:pimeloyl-ACP methyl ester carboxylesterase
VVAYFFRRSSSSPARRLYRSRIASSTTRKAATSIAEQERIAASLWQSELVQIDGAVHATYIDRAKECAAALRGFLDGFA